jgi:GT2 family glycosyltransferase
VADGPAGAGRITVVFPTYRARDAVAGLVEGIVRQRPPEGADAATWLEVIFIDNASPDDTVRRLEDALAAAAPPFPVRVVRNDENLGLARSFNRALGMVATEYVLTCHADCRFASDDYVARAVDLLDRNPDVAVVSGQSIADVGAGLSRVEKVYLAGNLMDIFPEADGELVPVGFAEGRCDAFRMGSLRSVGLYDTTLRRAGEDQVLSARLRAAGHRVCKAPQLRYFLSVSSDQDSLLKLVRHAELFGRVHPYLLLANRSTTAGVVGTEAGSNRERRAALRALQLAGSAAWLGLAVAAVSRRRLGLAGGAVVAVSSAKSALFAPYLRHLRFGPGDLVALAALQPVLDLSYAAGIARGLARVARPGGRVIT